ncbi:hypothetical protein ABDK56_05920 [Sphingomonas sp. ASV193]|uniref:hypothetical protein n=1 Tax=Sphingomonas sp. ASV193 TaxID=3144405 RepID=UPI0032E92EBE
MRGSVCLLGTDSKVSVAMLQLVNALALPARRHDVILFALRAAQFVTAARRMLVLNRSDDVHADLWLSSELGEYRARWSESESIARNIAGFRSDSYRMVSIVEDRLAANEWHEADDLEFFRRSLCRAERPAQPARLASSPPHALEIDEKGSKPCPPSPSSAASMIPRNSLHGRWFAASRSTARPTMPPPSRSTWRG